MAYRCAAGLTDLDREHNGSGQLEGVGWMSCRSQHRATRKGSGGTKPWLRPSVSMEPSESHYFPAIDLPPIHWGLGGDADDFSLILNIATEKDLDWILVMDNSENQIVDQGLLQKISKVHVTGNEQADCLAAHTDLFVPFSLLRGILFHASEGANVLELISGLLDAVPQDLKGSGLSRISLAQARERLNLHYRDSKEITDRFGTVACLFANGNNLYQSLRLSDDSSAEKGISTLDSASTDAFAAVPFDSATDSLAIQARNLRDNIIVTRFGTAAGAALDTHGGLGDNTLTGLVGTATYSVDGDGADAETGATSAAFSDIENLQSGAGDDIFRLTSTRQLTGAIWHKARRNCCSSPTLMTDNRSSCSRTLVGNSEPWNSVWIFHFCQNCPTFLTKKLCKILRAQCRSNGRSFVVNRRSFLYLIIDQAKNIWHSSALQTNAKR